ncbi:unnamed protein product [Closterium sp. Yama58-4]|nr:unnamed protein product [Closterium sp. Yama58-4]
MAGTHDLGEVMEMRMRALGVQLEETRRRLDEAERRRVVETRKSRGQVKERERELAAVKGEVTELKDALKKLDIELKISQSEGDEKTAWEFFLVTVIVPFLAVFTFFTRFHQTIQSASQKTHLDLNGLDDVSDAMLAHVSAMTHVKSINLDSSSGFSAEGIKHLYRLPRLETLDLQGADVSDSALEGIGSLTSLKQLYFLKNAVTDAGLSHLTALSSLKELWLGGCMGVTNAGMVHVGRLTGLEDLRLGWTAVTEDGLQQLTALTKLTTLRLPDGDMVYNEDVRRWIGLYGAGSDGAEEDTWKQS